MHAILFFARYKCDVRLLAYLCDWFIDCHSLCYLVNDTDYNLFLSAWYVLVYGRQAQQQQQKTSNESGENGENSQHFSRLWIKITHNTKSVVCNTLPMAASDAHYLRTIWKIFSQYPRLLSIWEYWMKTVAIKTPMKMINQLDSLSHVWIHKFHDSTQNTQAPIKKNQKNEMKKAKPIYPHNKILAAAKLTNQINSCKFSIPLPIENNERCMGLLFRFLHAFCCCCWFCHKMGMEKPSMPTEKKMYSPQFLYIYVVRVQRMNNAPKHLRMAWNVCSFPLLTFFVLFLALITTVSVQFLLLLLLTTDMQRTFIVVHPLFVQLPILNGQATVRPIVSIVFLKYLVHEVSSFQRTNCKKKNASMKNLNFYICFSSYFFFQHIHRALSISIYLYSNWHWPCYCNGIVLASCMETAMFESM